MASDVMGANMDVHAGGHDLKFPHHDNELCQSEAFHGCSQWVNHFWHFGHLLIKGLKMSKSLKNFITIRQALEDFSARQLRLLFLLQPWDKRMDFSDQTVGEVKTKEATLKNYFDEVKAVLRDSNWQKAPTTWGVPERKLHASFLSHQAAVHTALCDNFNTPGAMGALLAIASDAFAYLTAQRAGGHFDALLLQTGAVYVTRMLRVFGVITHEELGFPVAQGGGGYEEQVGPVLTALVQFRDKVHSERMLIASECMLIASECMLIASECMLIASECMLIASECMLMTSECMLIGFIIRCARRPSRSAPTPSRPCSRCATSYVTKPWSSLGCASRIVRRVRCGSLTNPRCSGASCRQSRRSSSRTGRRRCSTS